jgi:LPS-assembly protein
LANQSLAARAGLLFISTIALLATHQHLCAQVVTTKEPLTQATQTDLPQEPAPQQSVDLSNIPHATILPDKAADIAILQSDTQSKHGDVYLLAGSVEIDFRDHVLRADNITYDASTGETELLGHVKVTGGDNDEYIQATHGTYNINTDAGTFYDVNGSVGLSLSKGSAEPTSSSITSTSNAPSHLAGYQSPNPFLFSGRMVVKTGPAHYDVYDGAVTSCLLPRPDWQLFSHHFVIDDKKAKASNSVFRILGIPLLPMPYVTHPTDTDDRQSGILIPEFSYSSASQNTGSKGLIIGEQGYLTLGRSADITVGLLYYSLRGFSENGTIRYRGPGENFFNAHFSALQDRGFTTTAVNAAGNTVNLYINQGGQDVTTSFRWQFNPTTRLSGDAEYLSNYVYREVFTENFNQSVSTDITSTVYVMNQQHGYSTNLRFDRYQGLKVVPIPVENQLGQEVKVFHAPSVDFSADDHHIEGTALFWNMDASVAGLKRTQPTPPFTDSGMVGRIDVRPELTLPLHFGGWNILASAAARESFYSNSRVVPPSGTYGPNAIPIEANATTNRADGEAIVELRPPVMERTFDVAPRWQWLLGKQVRHTIEPDITYRYVRGISNFFSILRFDDVDLASDTDELDYAFTQHLYFSPRTRPVKVTKPKPGCSVTAQPTLETPQPVLKWTGFSPSGGSSGLQATESASQKEGALAPEGMPEEVTAVEPTPQASNDANGIPNASTQVPDQPMRTHRRVDPCAPDKPLPTQQEWFSWKIEQKFFRDTSFGHAVIDSRRNIFDTTLALSGIAFLTEPRDLSPVVSRMRFRTSGHTDFEWDLDYDTGAKKINSSNVFLDVHSRNYFGGLSYSLLNAPGRTYTEVINSTNTVTNLTRSAIANFSQMRLLSGYGNPSRPGLSAGAGAGIDLNAGSGQDNAGVLQYLTIQASYNWNCCGLSVEYRKYDLGDIRNEGTYRFNFTLANIGTAGNLRRAESLF